MEPRSLVIGYGNALCGDDGVGPYIVRQLGRPAIACHQLTPELVDPLSQVHLAIFVDAHAAVPPGQIRIFNLHPRFSPALYCFDPETLLGWSQQVYGRAPQAFLIGIGGLSFVLGDPLSPPARRACREALHNIRKINKLFFSKKC